MEVRIARKVSYRELLANADYRLLIFAQSISNFGDWLIIGILVSIVTSLVPTKVNPALAIAGLWIAKIAPSLFFSPFIGALVDRLDRKRGMIISDILRGILVLLLPVATFFGGLFFVYAVIFLSEIFTLFFVPAKDASIPNLVERNQLIDANSLSFTLNQATMLLGLGVGTTMILIINRLISAIPVIKGLAGTYTAIYIDAFTFFISAIVLGFMHLPRKQLPLGMETYGILEEIKDTFRFIASNPRVKSIIISAGFSVFGLGTILIIGPQYAQVALGLGRDGFLILLTMLALGLVVGAIASSWLSHLISKETLFSSSLMIIGLSLIAFAVYAVVVLAITLSLLAGFALGVLYVTAYTIFHEQVSDVLRGRLFTALEADLRMALIISFLLTSAVSLLVPDLQLNLFGRTFSFLGSEIIMLGGGLVIFAASLYSYKVTRTLKKRTDNA